jgi:hypothetical protein
VQCSYLTIAPPAGKNTAPGLNARKFAAVKVSAAGSRTGTAADHRRRIRPAGPRVASGPPRLLASPHSTGPRPTTEPTTLESLLTPFALQDACPALQDACSPQVIALVGLIAWVRGTALQNAIAADLREIMVAGHAILAELQPSQKSSPTRRTGVRPPHSRPARQ